MADTNRKPASTVLRDVAVQEETKTLAINKWREDSEEYGFTKVPTEIDGALEERVKQTVINFFGEDNPYKNPDGENV
jgi:hypothetical protein